MSNKEYTVELPDSTPTEEKGYSESLYASALAFVKEAEEFKAVDLQRHLQCGFGTVVRILDALCENHIATPTTDTPKRYKSLAK